MFLQNKDDHIISVTKTFAVVFLKPCKAGQTNQKLQQKMYLHVELTAKEKFA